MIQLDLESTTWAIKVIDKNSFDSFRVFSQSSSCSKEPAISQLSL